MSTEAVDLAELAQRASEAQGALSKARADVDWSRQRLAAYEAELKQALEEWDAARAALREAVVD